MTYRVLGAGGETGRGRRPRLDQRPAGRDATRRDDRPGDAAADRLPGAGRNIVEIEVEPRRAS